MSVQDQIELLRAREEARGVIRREKLAARNKALAVFFSVLMPVVGYAYTGRWKAFFVMALSFGVLNVICTALGATQDAVVIFIMMAAPVISSVDNLHAIDVARAAS